MNIIRFIKLFLAAGFLAIAYAFIGDIDLFGIPTTFILLVFSVLAVLVLFIDSRNRRKK